VRAAAAFGLERRLADKQIRAEASIRHCVFQIAVGRCNHTDVYMYGLRSSDSFEFPRLQYSKECNLSFGGLLADFVEKDSAAIRQFKTTLSTLQGAGEGSLLVAE
jgi:hypothetical protein